jgi:hypothetical protein
MQVYLFNWLARPTLILFSLVFIPGVKAQNKESTLKRFHFQAGVGIASNSGAYTDLSLQAVSSKNFVGTLSYTKVEMDPKNLPSDYEPGYVLVIIIPVFDNPVVTTTIVSATVGKEFKTGRNSWFTPEVGLGYVSGEKLSFHPQAVVSDIVSATSNYSTSVEDKSTVGAVLRADINWAFASFMGMGAGVYGNLNSVQSLAGFHVKLMIGLMGRQKKIRANRAAN